MHPSPEKVASVKWVVSEKVASWKMAEPEKVAPSKRAPPEKVAPRKEASRERLLLGFGVMRLTSGYLVTVEAASGCFYGVAGPSKSPSRYTRRITPKPGKSLLAFI